MKILIDLNTNKNFDISELDNLCSKDNINKYENPFEFEENKLMSKFKKYGLNLTLIKTRGQICVLHLLLINY